MGAATLTQTQTGAGTRKGRVRVRHTLDTAVEVFLFEGSADFSVRTGLEAQVKAMFGARPASALAGLRGS